MSNKSKATGSREKKNSKSLLPSSSKAVSGGRPPRNDTTNLMGPIPQSPRGQAGPLIRCKFELSPTGCLNLACPFFHTGPRMKPGVSPRGPPSNGPSKPPIQGSSSLPPGSPLCKFENFPSGCTNDNCSFRHLRPKSSGGAKTVPTCRFEASPGGCREGAGCRFKHVNPVSPGLPETPSYSEVITIQNHGFASHLLTEEGKMQVDKIQKQLQVSIKTEQLVATVGKSPKISIVRGDITVGIEGYESVLISVDPETGAPLGSSSKAILSAASITNLSSPTRNGSSILYFPVSSMKESPYKALEDMITTGLTDVTLQANSVLIPQLSARNAEKDEEWNLAKSQMIYIMEWLKTKIGRFELFPSLYLIRLVDLKSQVWDAWKSSAVEHLKNYPRLVHLEQTDSNFLNMKKIRPRGDKIEITFESGDILDGTKWNCDAFVNSVVPRKDLAHAGQLSKQVASKSSSVALEFAASKAALANPNHEIIVTEANQVPPYKKIFHVPSSSDPSAWKKTIPELFREIQRNPNIKSIAIPAIGSGGCGVDAEEIAKLMVDELLKLATVPTRNLGRVCFVFESEDVRTSYKACFARFKLERSRVDTKFLEDVYEKLDGTSFQITPTCEMAALKISGSSKDAVNSAIARVKTLVTEKCPTHEISIEPKVMRNLLEKGSDLRQIALEYEVNIKAKSNSLVVEGRRSAEALLKIQPILTQIQTKLAPRDLKGIQWKFERKGKWCPYSGSLATQLDQAFIANRYGTLKFQMGETTFIMDFKQMVETTAENKWKTNIRRQLPAEIKQGLPKHWTHCTEESVEPQIVPILKSTRECVKVLSNLPTELQKNVQKIERVENVRLWRQYQAMKDNVKKEISPGTTLERILFHGTAEDAVPHINRENFNRSYAGSRAGKAHGAGNYFAVDFRLSYQSYAPSNSRGEKKVYQALVLTGEHTTGSSSMVVPPMRPNGTGRYHSTVDNIARPKMFVTYPDAAAYPEYIITIT